MSDTPDEKPASGDPETDLAGPPVEPVVSMSLDPQEPLESGPEPGGPPAPAALEAPTPEAPQRQVFDPAPPPPRADAGAAPPDTAGPHGASGAPAATPTTDAAVAGDGAGHGDVPPDDVELEARAAPRSLLARRWPLVLLPLLVIAIVVAAFAVKSNTDKAVDKVKTSPAFVTFRDKNTGFTIKYPNKWKRAERADPEIRLLVRDEGLDSLLVRVARTAAPFPADLTGDEAKQVADVVLKRETFAPERILREQAVNVNGAPGYYYLYTFDEEVKTDSGTQKVQGVHAHYIVFSGRRVFVLVFQALPTANFDKLAATFDAMAESFGVSPLASDAPDVTAAPDPAATSTTPSAPPATTAPVPPR
ncbi:MAG TPA: hypothetical protein VMZ51_02980 [Acidimicrobiales bacterium]|nr:hypothetical protein [Acidimicrobiales bacterium]